MALRSMGIHRSGEARMPAPPVLIVNPATDREFTILATSLLDGVSGPDDLQARLRPTHPHCVVRRREISNERVVVWYVYRDGGWIPSEGQEGLER
jgi:hypothetical protein